MNNKLLYFSKNDIPFPQGQVSIHNPSIAEISLIGENLFYLGCHFLCFSKDKLEEKDKINLKTKTNFDILMSMISQGKENNALKNNLESIEMVLFLLFPQFKVMFLPTMIVLQKQNQNGKQQHIINNDNFEDFKQLLTQMFCLEGMVKSRYNPINKTAADIAKKLEKREEMLRKKANGNKNIQMLVNYVSILSLGNHQSINQLMNYTVFQLIYQMRRYQRKYSYQVYLKAKMAGAENIQEVQNWMSQEQAVQTNPISSSKNIVEFD